MVIAVSLCPLTSAIGARREEKEGGKHRQCYDSRCIIEESSTEAGGKCREAGRSRGQLCDLV